MRLDILTGLDDRLLSGGAATGRPASFRYGVRLDIEIALYHDDGEATAYTQAEMEDCASWQFAIDIDHDHDTGPAVLVSTGFSLADGVLSFEALTSTEEFLAALATVAYADGYAELKGYRSGETLPALVVEVPARLRATVTGETASPPVEQEPDFTTAAQAESIAAGKMDSYCPTTEKTAPVDADLLTIWDSAAAFARKYLTWSALKTALEAAYGLLTGAQKTTLTGGAASDADALHTHPGIVTGIATAPTTEKTAPVDADLLTIWDSAAGFARKYLAWSALKTALEAAYGLLSVANKATLTGGGDADALHTHAYATAGRVATPAGTVVRGKVYYNNAGSWALADPDVAAVETCELWMALGTDPETDGMAAGEVATNSGWSWSTIGGLLWLDDDGALTETVPTETTHAGRVARPVGFVRSATSACFDGHILGSAFEEAGS